MVELVVLFPVVELAVLQGSEIGVTPFPSRLAIQLGSMDSRFFLKLLVHGTGLLSLKLYLDQIVVVVCLPRPMEGMGRLQFSDIFFHRTASSTTGGWSRWNI